MYWILLLCVCVARAQDGISVTITQGVVVGSLENGNYVFHGVPYAGSTSGENRFKAPTPAPTFPGEFHAIEKNVMCAHPTSTGLVGVEDCLRLSIYTKNVTASTPVLVWLQGEEFPTYKRAPYSYAEIVQSDIVFVTLNYRLSIFGFLCLGVPDAPGNAGLRDIVQGLKWIKDNIAGFGGDPNNVVLLGHGSGAAMVDLITISPLATGLVHKAIALSGSVLAPWAIAYNPVGHANAVGKKLGYSGNNREELAKLLAGTDLNVLGPVLNDFEFLNNSVLFAPCIENVKLNPNDTFLADAPITLLQSAKFSDIPYIGGHTNREGSIRAEQAAFNDWRVRMRRNFADFIQVDLSFESQPNKTDIVESIRQFHFPKEESETQRNLNYFYDYIGNTTVSVAVNRNIRIRSLISRSEVRFLGFAYIGDKPSWPLPQVPLTGARHGAILDYLFGFDLKNTDREIQKFLVERFTLFAYTGNPNRETGGIQVQWLPVPRSIHVGPTGQTSLFSIDEVDFWNNLYAKYYVPPKPVSSAGKLLSASLILLFSQVVHKLY